MDHAYVSLYLYLYIYIRTYCKDAVKDYTALVFPLHLKRILLNCIRRTMFKKKAHIISLL